MLRWVSPQHGDTNIYASPKGSQPHLNMDATPVYSPTQTTAFIRDPAAWYLRYVMKWHPKFIGKKEIAGFLGTAFADGAAVYHNGLQTLQEAPGDMISPEDDRKAILTKKAASVAVQSVKDAKARVIALGQSVYDDQNEAWDLLEKRSAEAVFKYVLNFPFDPADIIASELSLPDHGYCRLDLVIKSILGPMVVDIKTKLTLDIKYQAQTLREFEAAWQMLHYTWAYGDYTGEPIRRFAILLHVLEPKSRLPVLHPVIVNPELMQMWVQSARQVWKIMHGMRTGTTVQLDPIPWLSFVFYSKFGREDWADAFTKYFMDENLLSAGYVKEKPSA